MKICTKCGIEKHFESFHKKKDSKDGLHPHCKLCVSVKGKVYYKKNKDHIDARAVEYQKANPEVHRKASEKYKTANLEKCRAAVMRNYYNNRDKWMSRKAFRINAKPKWAEDQNTMIKAKYQLAAMLTKETGVQYHVDHIVPLRHDKVCGLHVFENLRVITAEENLSKSNFFEVV